MDGQAQTCTIQYNMVYLVPSPTVAHTHTHTHTHTVLYPPVEVFDFLLDLGKKRKRGSISRGGRPVRKQGRRWVGGWVGVGVGGLCVGGCVCVCM